MSIARDRANRSGTDPVFLNSAKLIDSSGNLIVEDASGNSRKLIANEIHLGTSADKVILKRGSDGSHQFQKVASGGAPTTESVGGTKAYNTLNDLPATAAAGDQALVIATGIMYIWNTSNNAWYKVATIVNQDPVISSAGNASYSFATDGTPVSIEISASDPEGVTLQYKYVVSAGSIGSTATVTSSATSGGTYSALNANTLTTNKYFKITPSTNSAHAGSFSLTFSATDGVNVATSVSAFSLAFFTQMHVPSGTTMLLGMSFDGSALGKTGSWNTPTSIGTLGGLTFYTSGGYNTTMAGHAGYPSGGTGGGLGFTITELNSGNSTLGKTIIIWYKGTQTTVGGNYSIGVPILGDPGIGWGAIGLDGGKIATNSGSTSYTDTGTTNVADDSWHMLTWVHSDGTHARLNNGDMGMWVDGVYENKHDIYAANNHNAYFVIHDMFQVYGSGWDQPTKVDAFQIFDDELTDAQILEIYQGG